MSFCCTENEGEPVLGVRQVRGDKRRLGASSSSLSLMFHAPVVSVFLGGAKHQLAHETLSTPLSSARSSSPCSRSALM